MNKTIKIKRSDLENKIEEAFDFAQEECNENANISAAVYIDENDGEMIIAALQDNQFFPEQNLTILCRLHEITEEQYNDAGSEDDPENEYFDQWVYDQKSEACDFAFERAIENMPESIKLV